MNRNPNGARVQHAGREWSAFMKGLAARLIDSVEQSIQVRRPQHGLKSAFKVGSFAVQAVVLIGLGEIV